MNNINKAKELVLLEIEKSLSKSLSIDQIILIDKYTIDIGTAWIFFYNTKDFILKGNFLKRLGGNAPYIIEKDSLEIFKTGTAKSIEYYIERYELYKKGDISKEEIR